MTVNYFSDCSGRAEHLRRLIDLENELSPAEMATLWQERGELPEDIVPGLDKTYKMMMSGRAEIRRFARTKLSQNVNFYSNNGPRAGRSLLVCFCGNVNRLMVPIPVFLQFVPQGRFDVLIVRDPTRRGYLDGVPGFATDLAKTVEMVRGSLPLQEYRDVRCLGTSAGGAAALYAGIMLGAERAISVGGKHRSAVAQTLDGTFDGMEFDRMIETSHVSSTTNLYAIYGEKFDRDVRGAQSLKKHLASLRMVVAKGVDHHNVLLSLMERGQFVGFLQLFLIGPVTEIDRMLGVDT